MHHSWPQNNKSGIIMQPDIVMFCLFRPSSEVVNEGLVLKEAKPLQNQLQVPFCLAPGFESFPAKLSNELYRLTLFSNSEVLHF